MQDPSPRVLSGAFSVPVETGQEAEKADPSPRALSGAFSVPGETGQEAEKAVIGAWKERQVLLCVTFRFRAAGLCC